MPIEKEKNPLAELLGEKTLIEAPLLLADARTVKPAEKQYSPPKLEIKLDLSEEKFQKYFSQRIPPLQKDAKEDEVFATLYKLYDLLKISAHGGLLGIEYQSSTSVGKLPKTPEEVLTPEKDKKLRADCDELSLLFFFTAKKLGVPIDNIGFLDITLQTKTKLGTEVEEQLHVAALNVKGKKYIFDLTYGIHGEVSSFDFAEINRFYGGREAKGEHGETVMLLGIRDKPAVVEGEKGACALYYRELGVSYNNMGQYEQAYAAYQKAYELLPAEVPKEQFSQVCINAGENSHKNKEYEKAEFYFREAVKLEDKPKIKENLIMALGMQKDKKKNEEAFSMCNELIKQDKMNPEFYKLKAWVAVEVGNKDMELKTLEDWVKETKSNESFEHLSSAYYNYKIYDSGLALCDEWIKVKPFNPAPYFNKAIILQRLGILAYNSRDFVSAENYFKEAIDVCQQRLKFKFGDEEILKKLKSLESEMKYNLDVIHKK